VTLHDHGVDPDYVARIRSAGYGNLTVDQIIRLHDHGVD
jgi:GT2 family glycosyltransferase